MKCRIEHKKCDYYKDGCIKAWPGCKFQAVLPGIHSSAPEAVLEASTGIKLDSEWYPEGTSHYALKRPSKYVLQKIGNK